MWCRRAIQGSSAAVYVAMPDFVGWFGAKRAIRMVPSMFSPRALAPLDGDPTAPRAPHGSGGASSGDERRDDAVPGDSGRPRMAGFPERAWKLPDLCPCVSSTSQVAG